jgi:muramoyltetrapeptide carboxypeptidase LdcA involved in peptidoglycan recycling
MNFVELPKLKKGDRVAVISPSFAAPARWPHVYELGLRRLKEVFELEPVAFPATAKADATDEDRAADLIASFSDPDIKAVVSTIGGDHQITYVKNLPPEPFLSSPKAFFGYSDNTHFADFLWQLGIPSFYGGALFTEFAMQTEMDKFTVQYLKKAFFERGSCEIEASPVFNDIGLSWDDLSTLNQRRRYQQNSGWYWDGTVSARGTTWGGCLESLDEILRHRAPLPTPHQFENIVLILETCEELSPAPYVYRVFRALGELGILERVKGVLMGRAKGWEFDKQLSDEEKERFKEEQRETVLSTFRKYNSTAPVVQNLDFGHTAPQICMPYGREIVLDSKNKKITVDF